MKNNFPFPTKDQTRSRLSLRITAFLLLSGLLINCQDHLPPPLAPAAPGTVTVVRGLQSPSGVDIDPSGRVWIAEAGTGNNNGRVSFIGADGTVNPVINGFASSFFQGEISGLSHLLFADGGLYMLHSNGKLYKANVASFKAGDTPLLANDIAQQDDIAAFVNAQPLADNPQKDSHAYQMALGPNGDLFMADAGANVIVRRNKVTSVLSIVANIPGMPNPTPVGPPNIQSVPTGVAFDGANLLVSTLNGFPFPAGRAIVYQVTPDGVVTKYQEGFNSMTGIDVNNGLIVLEYGTFGLPAGWVTNSGRLVRANKPGTTVLATGLNQPTALKKINANSYYVTSLGDGTLLKVTF